jgi:hypothetical protein
MKYRREDRGSVKMQRKPLGDLFGPSNTPYCSFSCSSLFCQVRNKLLIHLAAAKITSYFAMWAQRGELANQKLRDRFHGENDPLAAKIMRRAEEDLTLMPPEDKSITTLYLGGLPAGTIPGGPQWDPRGPQGLGRAALSYHWLLTAW